MIYSTKKHSQQLFVSNQKSFYDTRLLLIGINFLCQQFEQIFSLEGMNDIENLEETKIILRKMNSKSNDKTPGVFKLLAQKVIKEISANSATSRVIKLIVNIRSLYDMDPTFYQNHVIKDENCSEENLTLFMEIMKKIARAHVLGIIRDIDEELTRRNSISLEMHTLKEPQQRN